VKAKPFPLAYSAVSIYCDAPDTCEDQCAYSAQIFLLLGASYNSVK